MTKIVYNACYGGFGLSAAAMKRIAEIKGWQYLAPDGTSSWDSGWILDEDGEQHSQYDLDGWRTDHALVQACLAGDAVHPRPTQSEAGKLGLCRSQNSLAAQGGVAGCS